MHLLIAIDDTDNRESIGTGRLARRLASDLQKKGLVEYSSVTRHQLLVHPDIPYTSHNSCACVEVVTTNGDMAKIYARAKAFLREHFNEGANPGLCVAEKAEVAKEMWDFGARAQQEVIRIEEARDLASKLGLYTWWYGETGQGCIGAMAGIGLRSTGNDGRFIDLKGIRDIKGVLRVKDILSRSLVKHVSTVSGDVLPDQELIDTQDWVRPSLQNDLPVLLVKKNSTHWQPAEARKRRQ